MSYKPYGTDPNMDKLVDSDNWVDRSKAAKEGYGLDILVNDPVPRVREAVARNSNGNPEILNKFVGDEDWYVRNAVVGNCKGNIDILNQLVDDKIWLVRAAVAKSCKGNPDILNKLVNDDNWEVRQAVAENCNGNADILNKLVDDKALQVRRIVEDFKLKNLLLNSELVASYRVDIGRYGDESWYDRTNYYKSPDNKFYLEYFEGYMNKTTIREVTEDYIISDMEKAKINKERNIDYPEAYQSYSNTYIKKEYVTEERKLGLNHKCSEQKNKDDFDDR